MNKVIVQKWAVSQRGWDTNPKGFSLHKSRADLKAYLREYWGKMPPEPPEDYASPVGNPYWAEVDPDIFKKMVESTNGIHNFGDPPPVTRKSTAL